MATVGGAEGVVGIFLATWNHYLIFALRAGSAFLERG